MELNSLYNIIKEVPMGGAVRFERFFHLPLLQKLRWPVKLVFYIALALFVFGFLTNSFARETLSLLLSFVLLSFSLGAILFILNRFSEHLKQVPVGKDPVSRLTFEGTVALVEASTFAKQKTLSSSVFLYFLLKRHPRIRIAFSRLLLDFSSFMKILKKDISKTKDADDFQKVLELAAELTQKHGKERIETEELIAALAQENLLFHKYLIEADLNPQDIQSVVRWQKRLEQRVKESKEFWTMRNLRKRGGIAQQWAAGFSPTLNAFGQDLSDTVRALRFPKVVGHERELEGIARILARRQLNNVLLIGEPGSGRQSIVEDITSKSVLGESLPEVNYKRIVELDIPSLLAKARNVREVESVLNTIFQEIARAGNIILVLNEFHNFVGSSKEVERLGMIDITGILTKYLKLPQFQIIAVTSFSGLHRYIEPKGALLSLFEKVEVAEISKEEAFIILEDLVPGYEKKYKRSISYQAIREIIELSTKYIQAVPLPKKAIDLLDETMVYLSQTKDKVLLAKHVETIVEERTQIPVGQMEAQERETLLNLEELIHQRIINQNEAVREVSSSLRRARSEIGVQKGPMGDFLFLGPTGVGKTETAKALAAIYFGSEKKLIRLDMSEFQNVQDIPRLLGTATQEGLLTTPVREDPFSLVLLDELEKAHPNILNLFLQILDEGYVTDGLSRKVSFLNTIIIATSNAGYRIILKALKEQKEVSKVKQELLDYLFQEGIFRPEFLNRFDAIVIFQSLSKEHLLAISGLMIKKLQKGMKDKGIEFVVTNDLKEKIVELGYNPTFGARNMQRVIQDKIEDALAEALLRRDIKKGDKISIDPNGFRVNKVS